MGTSIRAKTLVFMANLRGERQPTAAIIDFLAAAGATGSRYLPDFRVERQVNVSIH
jgi:hypothetical protein